MPHFFERSFWLLIVGLIGMAVKILGDISSNIAMLNIKMETVIEQITTQKSINLDHENRIRSLESLERKK